MTIPDTSRRSDAHRTLILTEVLSSGPFAFDGDHNALQEAISIGDCSGRILSTTSVPISDDEASRLLAAQGSDPDFLMGSPDDDEPPSVVPATEERVPEYFDEAVVQVANGCQVRVPAYPADCAYVRVISAQGFEVGYWTHEEWKDSPAEVMGAIFGAALSPVSQVTGTASAHER